MRKCDVCLTPIPEGMNRCPNCGQRYKSTKNRDESYIQFQSQPALKERDYKKVKKTHTNIFKIIKTIFKGYLIIGIGVPLIVFATLFFVEIADFSMTLSPESVDETYSYESFEDYDSLISSYPNEADKVSAYRDYLINITDDEYAPYENYEVDEDGLSYAYISNSISHSTEDIAKFTSIALYYHQWDDQWYISYSTYEVFEEGKTIFPDYSYLDDMANLSGMSKDILVNKTKAFISNLDEEELNIQEIEIEDYIFTLDFYDNILNYNLSAPIELN